MNLDLNYAQVLFGQHAVHVPAWLVVQHSGDGLVSFVGASRVADPHPLRYGSECVHQLIIGELLVRPHRVTASDACIGSGLSHLAADPFPLMDGELLVGTRS